MKAYDIIQFEKDYKYVVVATSYENPIDEIEDIEQELNNRKYYGKILFDLLLCNGMNSNRYIEMDFDVNYFDITSSIIIESPTENIKKFIYEYFRNRPLLIENSVLPRAQRYLINAGI